MTKDELYNLDVGDLVMLPSSDGGDGKAYMVAVNFKDQGCVVAIRSLPVSEKWALLSKAGHER